MHSINFNSLEKVCNHSNQLMFYGWDHTHYYEIISLLKMIKDDSNTIIKKHFDFWIGDKFKRDERVSTLEGRKMERIEYDSIVGASHSAKICKSAIVNLVLENCKRTQENLSLIPLIFCIDIDNNPYPKSVDSIATRALPENSRITNKELRRIYKLCHLQNNFIADIALKTVKFVKIYINDNIEYEFEELKPFWEDSKWKNSWELRQETKVIKSKINKWEPQLIKAVETYNLILKSNL